MASYAFLTPSYSGDLERFLLLRESIQRFFHESCNHYVVVPREDRHSFERCADSGVQVLVQEDFVPKYYYPTQGYRILSRLLPKAHKWRFHHLGGRPGWITQQVVKISAPEIVPTADAVVIIDSDVVFMRHFSSVDLHLIDDPVLVRITPQSESAKQREHFEKARQILQLPSGPTEHHYMGWPAIWYREWILAMRKYIENLHGIKWQRVLYDHGVFSEYTIYGTFIEEILRPEKLKILETPFHHLIWDETSYEIFRSGHAEIPAEKLAVTIQSNIKIDPSEYRELVYQYWSGLASNTMGTP
ncbi:DUF6492 family protein [Geobacter sp.]|uniref:DUF6492 family protein n=1 Tax=Geobacter sp. TaxID=46610 RepID=UPI0027B9DE1D|nr:DUF6492 family protein [Geobacter sp.]